MYRGLQRTLRNNDALILGDVNLPHIYWQTLTGSEGQSLRMLDFVEHNCLRQMVTESMRDNNILELVLVTQENLVNNVSVGEHLRSFDNKLVRLDLRPQTRIAENNIFILNFKRADFVRIRQPLTNFQLVSNIDIEESWQEFKARLLTKQNKFVQSFENRWKVKNLPHFNNEIKLTLQRRIPLYKR